MRNLILSTALLVVACDNNNINNNVMDMAVPVMNHDMTASPDLNGLPACDVIRQDCPSGQKCTFTQDSMGNTNVICMPTSGTKMPGDSCTRSAGVIGDDDCAKGLFCTARGTPLDQSGNPTLVCTKLCQAETDCDSGQGCSVETDDFVTGACIPKCTPYLGQGKGGCSAAMDCSSQTLDLPVTDVMHLSIMYFCRTVSGSAGPFESCASGMSLVPEICAPGLTCDFNAIDNGFECMQLCDDSHACQQPTNDASPTSCSPFYGGMGMSSNLSDGTCQ